MKTRYVHARAKAGKGHFQSGLFLGLEDAIPKPPSDLDVVFDPFVPEDRAGSAAPGIETLGALRLQSRAGGAVSHDRQWQMLDRNWQLIEQNGHYRPSPTLCPQAEQAFTGVNDKFAFAVGQDHTCKYLTA